MLDLRFEARGCRLLNFKLNGLFGLEVDEIELFVARAIVVVFGDLTFFQKWMSA